MITLTTNAINEINKILASETERWIRISVRGGGCSGFSYEFDITSKMDDDDIMVQDIVLVDPMSMQYLNNAVVDYKETLMYSSFSIDNPNVTSRCGCGSSFSV